MIEHKISRRALFKSAAKASVCATIGLSTSITAATAIRVPSVTGNVFYNRAEQFVYEALINCMQASEKIQNSDIRLFSKDLTAHLGPNFDYKKEYSSVMGEYNLARQFIKSTDLYSNTAPNIDSVIRYIGLNTGAISA